MRIALRLLTLSVSLTLGLLQAQEFRSTISGHVYDATGSAVPNAKIQAVNPATNEVSTATSDPSGTYTIPFLRPGSYKISVSAAGFKIYNRDNVTLQAAQTSGLDVSLEVGSLTESVNVSGDVTSLETQTASRSGVVNQLQVAELPLNARNPFMLGTMMSGVVFRGAAIWQRPFDNGAIAQWSVNGGRESNNEFMLDGAPNNAQAGSNNIAYVPIVDAVQEFNVQQNTYDAQYGKTGGGVFNVVLKSGGNDFHFVAWEFLRRKALDANTFQSNAVPLGLGKKAERANHILDQYGFQLDGPVLIPKLITKNSKVRLFYLGSFENYRENTPNPLTNSVPEAEMRTGNFSKLANAAGQPVTIFDPITSTFAANGDPVRTPFAGNIIPASRINGVAKAVSAYLPSPNSAARAGQAYGTNNFLLPNYVNKDKFYNLILKFDMNFGDKHRAYFRHASNDRTEDRAVNGIDNAIGTDGQQPFQRINDAYVADWVWTASPTTIINVRGSYNRFIEKGLGRANEGFDLTKLGLSSSLVNSLPGPTYFGRWEWNGYSSLGRYQSINLTNNYNLAANITKIAGSHTIKTGVDVRRIHYLQQNSGNILFFRAEPNWTSRLWNQNEPTAGDSYATFMLGLLQRDGVGTASAQNYPLYPFNRQWYMAPYFQDDWKVTRRLTMQLGLRYDYNGPPDEKWNRQNRGFDAAATSPLSGQISAANQALYPQLRALKGGFQFAGINGNDRIAAHRDLNNFQPRVGAAYKINEKLVVRGGWGLYFLNPNNNFLQTAGFQTNTPIVQSLDGGRTPIENVLSNPFPTGIQTPPGASRGLATFAGLNNNWFNPAFNTPYMHQFSFGLQYQVSQSSTLDLSYVGSRSRDLNNERAFNIPTLDFRKKCNLLEGGSPTVCDANVPNPFKGVPAFAGTSYFTADQISNFNINRPYPQFSGDLLQQGLNGSNIYYNSLQVNYNQRIAKSLIVLTNYTFSKTVERFGYADAYANVQQQGLYFNDRPHFFKFTAVYELPIGKGKTFMTGAGGLTQKIVGGWEVTSFYTAASGEPNDLPANLIQLKDPRVNNVDWKGYQVRGWSPCVLRQFNDGSVRPQQYSLDRGCGTDTSAYPWLQTASYAPRALPFRSGQIRKHHAFTWDASVNKTVHITERMRVQFRGEVFNLANHNYFGRDNFNTDPNNANFGTVFPSLVSNQNGFPRQIQLGMKFLW